MEKSCRKCAPKTSPKPLFISGKFGSLPVFTAIWKILPTLKVLMLHLFRLNITKLKAPNDKAANF